MAGKQISALDAQIPEKTDVLAQQDSAGIDSAKKSTIAEILALIDASDVPAHADTHEQGGSDAVSLDASQLATGTLADARLPTEVPLTDETNTFTATQTFDSVVCADIKVDGTELDPTGHTVGQVLQSNGTNFLPANLTSVLSNPVINPTFGIVQRQSNPATLTTYNDGTYCADRWVALFQDANGQFGQITGGQQRYAGQLKKTASGTTRLGTVQWIESQNCYHLRGQTVTLQMRVRCSENTKTIRCGLIESTKTEDTITRDPLSDWSTTPVSLIADYTFSGTPGSVVSDTNWQTLTYTTTLGGSFNNLGILVWSETTLSQNATLDIEAVKMSVSDYVTQFVPRSISEELNLCLRYCNRIQSSSLYTNFATGATSSTNAARYTLLFPRMFAVPTLSRSSLSTFQAYVPGDTTASPTALSAEQSGEDNIQILAASTFGAAASASILRGDNTATTFLLLEAEL